MQDLSTNAATGRREPAIPFKPVIDPAGWKPEALAQSGEHLFHLDDTHIAELDSAIRAVDTAGLPIMRIARSDFSLPTLATRLAEIRTEILDGRGIVQIRGFPVERYTREQAAIAFWGLAMHLGDRVACQNAKGHLLGHVSDIGQTNENPDQRGPYSRDGIPFHVDCSDIVGLMCLQPAQKGGASGIASSVTVHNEMLRRRPDLVRVLAQPFYRDRRGEVPRDRPPWYRLAAFHYHGGFLSTTIEPKYMLSAERHPGVPAMLPVQHEALTVALEIAHEMRLDIDFHRGDMQFLNNHVIMHTRERFEDDAAPERRRHLLRIWLLCKGCRPLPTPYFERHGAVDEVDWPGGIVGRDTVFNVPLEAS